MAWKIAAMFYFATWLMLAVVFTLLNVYNYDWENSSHRQGVFLIISLAIIQTNVLELVVIALGALVMKVSGYRYQRSASHDNLTLVMNYNLLALSAEDVEETYETMFHSYMGNMAPNVSCVLVSATKVPHLKEYELRLRDSYRAMISNNLHAEGVQFANGLYHEVDPSRLEKVWTRYANLDKDTLIREYLPDICHYYANEFMCLHRVSRVLKKCGQYQDLMLLSEFASNAAYTYTSRHHYGNQARMAGEPMFTATDDMNNVLGRRFDYTLVLDSDTEVHTGTVAQLLSLAAAYPEKGIIQPAIKLKARDHDSIFMHLERMRQDVHEPFTRVMTDIMGQSGYYGKALLKNRIYIDSLIGTPDHLLEKVPLDVLSHDTFEAAVMRPMYAPKIYLYESPCFNYITWNMREGRWNKGEVLLSMYFIPVFGTVMRFMQRAFQGRKADIPKLRTKSSVDFISYYIAFSAFRQMLMKPSLLLFILGHVGINLHFYWIPFLAVTFMVVIFPKFAVMHCNNIKAILIETICSFIQFTPEAVLGTVRLFRAIEGNICSCCPGWMPQRSLEEELRNQNPIRVSLKYLWPYMLVALVCILAIMPYAHHFYMYILFFSVFILPFYTGVTSYDRNITSAAAHNKSKAIFRGARRNGDGDSIVSDLAVDIVENDGALVHGRHTPGANYKTMRRTTPDEWNKLVADI